MTRWPTLVGLVVLFPLGSFGALDLPPTAADVQALVKKQPLTAETWPKWRDYYVRLYYEYEVGEPIEFYEQIGEFFGGIASANKGTLTGPWATDPMAWIALSHHIRRTAPDSVERCEEASRRALALGDPSGMSSLNLAWALIEVARHSSKPDQLTAECRQKLMEAEKLLRIVEQTAPQARLSYERGSIAQLQGEKAAALRLFRQGAFDHPKDSRFAANYLALWLCSEEAAKPFAGSTEPFVKRFPQDSHILALYALALYRDERFSEAYETLQQVCRQDEQAAQSSLGPEGIVAIEEGRWLTPHVLEGLKLIKSGQNGRAILEFRQALQENAQNIAAARLLARSLLARKEDSPMERSEAEVSKVLAECTRLCQQFPQDAELQVAHAAARFLRGTNDRSGGSDPARRVTRRGCGKAGWP